MRKKLLIVAWHQINLGLRLDQPQHIGHKFPHIGRCPAPNVEVKVTVLSPVVTWMEFLNFAPKKKKKHQLLCRQKLGRLRTFSIIRL